MWLWEKFTLFPLHVSSPSHEGGPHTRRNMQWKHRITSHGYEVAELAAFALPKPLRAKHNEVVDYIANHRRVLHCVRLYDKLI